LFFNKFNNIYFFFNFSEKLNGSFNLSADQFHQLAPCHVVFSNQFEILQITDNMKHSTPDAMRSIMLGSNLWDIFRLPTAGMDGASAMNWDDFRAAVILNSKGQFSFRFESINETTKSGKVYSYIGKIIFLKNEFGEETSALFLCSPDASSLDDMYDQGVSIQDLKNTDESRLQMLLNDANTNFYKTSSTEVRNHLG
jgi:hypothetical protein